ncbi:Polyamine oxidase [Komagataella phaffii CBS 7435]|uniref:Polyamine oxidase, converts spermine to spermidine n=2 Tax=Komagataella phaffii TaxID=460519 RepID=C4R918_KOMPG|nr:Polyamine oxidase, converts spermine to spermidine [Komagataella phaffii GS115]AOA64977.1 GQ67_05215T0 [Komagataella phaffii]CAH2450498.1 Polyamine oxidase [Komagataella phaffii CBS 7435]AOA70301.1 GQ68_05197T0 [Komagataella phaffii GS115]CAY72093.1 Polyamine oxidase, converts spermine to spermidine [Komagataella phaffii GS115]CCA40304.1 Polyamine oxidase [Komagataella phaffii CBS 7435]
MSQPNPNVIIVGAGISGIKAAVDLKSNGVNALILEGRDRIGGRLVATHETSVSLDLGASWFHRVPDNVLYEKVINKEYKSPVEFTFDDSNVKIMAKPVDLLPFWQFVKSQPQDDTLRNFVYKYLQTTKLNEVDTQDFIKFVRGTSEIGGAGNWCYISGKNAVPPSETQGRDAFVTSTYAQILQQEASYLDPFQIITSSKVTEIIKNTASSTYTVKTSSGVTYSADFVIVTVPLGVLKSDDISFTPPLPTSISSQLNKVQMGNIAKVIFEFETVFWDETVDKWLLFPETHPEEGNKFGHLPLEYEPSSSEFTALVCNIFKSKSAKILVTLVSAPIAIYLEAHPQEAWNLLKPMYSQISACDESEIPKPVKQVVTSWSLDPFSKGSVSATGPEDIPLIKEFIQGVGNLRFAGEHTSDVARTQAHGAYLTGQREASFIIRDIYKC